MSLSYRFVVATFRAVTEAICRIDASQIEKIPQHGPLIIYTNHINILEIPIIFTQLQPRPVHGMLLAERWNIPVLNWALDVTKTIPLHRGEADIDAIHQALQVLRKGEIIIIAPEGTRSHDGRLQAAHPGVVVLALHSQAQLIPVAYYGAENWKENVTHFKRSDFHLRVGRTFHLDAHGEKNTRQLREKMMDEMMVQLAQLLPEEYRGYYAGRSSGDGKYVVLE